MNKLLLFFTPLLLSFCSTPDNEDQHVYRELNKAAENKISDQTRAVIVINDNTCGSCNQKFCEAIAAYTNRADCEFIISADENVLDVSMLRPGPDNFHHDKARQLFINNVVSSSTVFFLEKERIDTVIEININNYDAKIAYIVKRIES